MIKRPALATLLSVAVCLSFATVHAPVTAADPRRTVDALFEAFQKTSSPGCAVGVARAGHPLLTRAYGLADVEHGIAITPDTVFEAGSISKQFVAASVLLLAQQGRVSLADDVRKYVPEIPHYGSRITIGHLLTHTSGLRDWGAVLEAAGRPRGTRVYSPDDVLGVVRRQRRLNFQPGAEYLYNNTGYSLLPLVVERIAGTSFAAFTSRHLFDPLGMRHTQWRDDITRAVDGRAIAYRSSDGTFAADMPMETVIGHAGLLTTIGDLLVWNEALDTGRLAGGLREEIERPTRLTSGRSIGYARGVVISRYRGVPEISHSGSTAGYRSFLARYPGDQLSVALLCNAATINAQQLARQVADAFLPPPRPPKEAPPGRAKIDLTVLAARAGLFRNRRTNEPFTLRLVDGVLRSGSGEALIALSPSTFRFENSVRRIEFPSKPGSAVRLITDENETVLLDRMTPVELTSARMAEYEGDYVSDEAEAAYTVSLEDGTLALKQPPAVSIALAASYADTFTTPRGWVVRFVRDGRRRVTAMSLGLSRVRDLRFTRIRSDLALP